MGWGICALFHGLGVFVFSNEKAIKERLIEKEYKREDEAIKEGDEAELLF
jgi:hypothetical protein